MLIICYRCTCNYFMPHKVRHRSPPFVPLMEIRMWHHPLCFLQDDRTVGGKRIQYAVALGAAGFYKEHILRRSPVSKDSTP